MPGPGKTENVVKFGAEFDADGVVDGMRLMGTEWSKRMRRIEKTSRESMKGAGKDVKNFMWQLGGAKKAYRRLYEEQKSSFKGARAGYTASLREVSRYSDAVEDLKKKIKDADLGLEGSIKPEELEALNEELRSAQKNLDKAQTKSDKWAKQRKGAFEGVRDIKEAFTFKPEDIVTAFTEAGAELWGPFESLLRKDLPGAIEKGGKLAGKGWEMTFKGGSKIFRSLGKAGDAFAKHAKARGGLAGAVGNIGGAAVGGMGKAMSGVLNVVSKLGPLLASVSTIVVGLVQLFLDAEAAAKDFNNEIMSTAGNAEFLTKNMGNVEAATKDMEKSLAGMYQQATDFSNLKWGLTKEQYSATSNAITAEGVSLKKLAREYDSASGYVKSFGDMVKMSVTYSKAFGVSLQEVGQFEGEMMSELGMNVDQVETSFQYMLRGAEEAGIATNKFFGIIRGFSADLSLFTVRMEDITKVMMALGKSMSPRDAQKFLQGITGFFKGQGLGERTKAVLMGGGAGATNARLQKSMDQKLGSLATDIAKTTGSPMDVKDLKKVLRKSDKQLAEWLASDGEKLSDDQKKAIKEAAIQQQKLLTNNPLDTASALADIDPFDTMEQLQAMSMSMFHKDLDKLTGIERLGAEAAVGVSDDQQKGFRKLNMGVESMKADLAHKLEKGLQLTDAEKGALDKLGIDAHSGDSAQKVRDMKAKAVWNAMSSDQQKLLTDATKQKDFTEQTAGNTTSIMTRLQILTDWFMRVFYQTILGIWESINSLPLLSNKHVQDQIDAAKSGNKVLADIAASSATHEEYQKKANEYWASVKTSGQKLEQTIGDITTPTASGGAPTVTLSKETQDQLASIAGPGMSVDQQAKATMEGTKAGTAAAAPDFGKAMAALASPHSVHVDVNNPPDFSAQLEQLEMLQANAENSADSLADIWKALRVRGIKLDKPFLENNIKKVFTDATYDAASEALTDYYMLSQADSSGVIDAIKKGADPKSLGAEIRKGVASGKDVSDALKDVPMTPPAGGTPGGMIMARHAAGGMVTDIQNGIANVRPAPGEGLTSIGKGERITPAGAGGGGGQVIELRLKGDLARIIDARSHNAIADHERMKTRR